jgi:AraC-like DNA-binding protein
MQYREIKTKPPLSEFVECFWTLEGDRRSDSAGGQPESEGDLILPDGCVEMVLNFGDAFREYTSGGRKAQPRRMIVGQMTQPIRIGPSGAVQLIGVRFHPGGTLPFFGMQAQEITNRYAAFDDVANELDREIVERVCDASSLDQSLAALEKLLTRRTQEPTKRDACVRLAVSRILRSNGRISVDELADGAGISARQLERRFSREVGLGPKVLCRILRFQQVFHAVDQNPGNWAAVAADCGYYDQSHLIRDFQQFAGAAPAWIVNNTGALTDFFTRKNRASGFSNTPY